jgi:ubiquinone/menaquinone biosynthesis C-methylase UbiE
LKKDQDQVSMQDNSSHDQLVGQLARRYSAGAVGYADHWQRMLAPMSAHLLDDLPLDGAQRILDIGCGPGTLTPDIIKRSPGTMVVGVDRSYGMLRRAPALDGAWYGLMDGRRLGFAAEVFDVALLAFVIFHFPDIVAGLREVRRVLRAGGSVGVTTFKEAPTFEAKRVWGEKLAAVQILGSSPVADLSAVDQGKKTNTPEKVSALLAAAGFETVDTRVDEMSYRWQPNDYLTVRASFGSSGVAFRALGAVRQTALLEAVRARYADLPEEAFRFTPAVITAVGRRPV